MISKSMVDFMTQFESEMKVNGIENAIEIECGKDLLNLDDYEA